jgi:outer membrane protein assembly factor BamB
VKWALRLNKRKAYLAIGLIVIVAVCGFIFYRYFVDWKNTGDVAVALKVVAKNQTSITLSWEEHGILFESRSLKMSTVEADTSAGSVWMEIWNTKNGNLTSTTIDNLSPNTTYWFYMTVNGGSYLFVPYESNIIRTTTYPSLLQIFIAFAILLGFAAVVLILMRRLKWSLVIFVPSLLIQVCEVTVSGANTYPSFFQIIAILAFIMGAVAVALMFIRKPKWAVITIVSLLLLQTYGLTVSSGTTSPSVEPTFVATQLWNYTTHGIVYPPPIIADGYMYTVSYSAYSSFVEVNCLNASTGAQVWNYGPRGFAGDLTVSEGYVYTSSTWGDLEAFNASTGAKIWNFTKENPMSTPLVADNRVYVTACGYVGSMENSIGFVFCFNAETGTKIWNNTIEASVGAPTVAGNMVYVPVRERFSTTRNVYAFDAQTGAKIWSYHAGGYAVSSLIVGGSRGYVYVESGDGNIYALSSFSGNTVWNYTIGGFSGSPIIEGDIIYICSNASKVYALDAKTGEKIWNYTAGDSVNTAIIAGNTFYIGAENTLYALDAANGTKIWNFTTESPVVPAAGTGGYVYVGSSANNKNEIYCLDASSGSIIWNYTSKCTYGNVLCDALVYRIVVSGGIVYVIFNQVVSNPYSHIPNSIIYVLEPTAVTPPLPLTVIVVVMDVMILAVAFLVYRVRLKGVKTSPATSPTKP